MKVKVRLFARLSDLAGLRDTSLEVDNGTTARAIFDQLAHQHPGLAGFDRSLMYAVNAEYVPADYRVHDGDEVTFIPPVSGGCRVL
ncbi:MAG TPA: molybdopterin converting factor subunit 1 [Dehalococcoidia bacterium]|nr:molybdopterin converting factor subunit 1 [Dehalococcoidia bacterium]